MAISQATPHLLITKISLKITSLKFHSNLSGANELMVFLAGHGNGYEHHVRGECDLYHEEHPGEQDRGAVWTPGYRQHRAAHVVCGALRAPPGLVHSCHTDQDQTVPTGRGGEWLWCQAIIWTNAGILLFGPLGTNFSEILIKVHTFPFKEMHFKMLSGKWMPFCLSLSVLNI